MKANLVVRRKRLPDAIESDLVAGSRYPDGAFGLLACASALGLVLASSSAAAATYVVDTTGDPGPGGTTSLRQAISQANTTSNNFILFDPSLNGSTITLQQGEIAINEPMYLVGPGADKLTISGNDASRIFNISTASNTPIAVTLADLTLSHGHAGGNHLGGAIYAANVSLTLQDSVFESNYGRQEGGAIFSHSGNGIGSVTKITRTTIANNITDSIVGQGGGFLVWGGTTLQIVDSVISGNKASESAGGFVYDVDSTTINNTLITGNSSSGSSGGLNVFHDAFSGVTSAVAINNSTISGNTSAFHGGGLKLGNVVATLTGDTISANSAGYTGGGVFVFNTTSPIAAQLSLQQSTVTGNSATKFGGGIDASGVDAVSISRSLIGFNNVYDPSGGGGGLALRFVKTLVSVDNSTIYGNYAYNNGGGIGIFDAGTGNVTTFSNATIAGNVTFNYASNGILGAGTPHINGSIIANGTSHSSNQDVDGTFAESYSLIRNVGSAVLTPAPGNKNGQDPLLGPLTVNGGPTLSMLPMIGSPVLDAGPTAITSGVDQRGLPRFVNGRVDMGAVERQYPEDVIFRNGFDSS